MSNELLCNPEALTRSDVAEFFELDNGLWHRTRASSADEKAAAIACLQSACRKFVLSRKRRSRAATRKAQVDAEAQAAQAIARQASLWGLWSSPKRRTGSCGADEDGDAKHFKRARASPRDSPSTNPRPSKAEPDNPPLTPVASPLWEARERCVQTKEKTPSDTKEKTPSDDVPLQRSGISDVVGAIAL